MASVAELAPAWMPPELIDAWYSEYLELGGASVSGSAANASEIIRSDPKYRKLYDQFFPGNRREDGSLRLSERDYRARTEGYGNALLGVNVNPELFESKFAALIEGDVGEGEFVRRIESMYERVIDAAPGIRDFYAANYALDMTDSAIIASFLDPDVGNSILDRSIAISEIGGEASMRRFDIDVGFAEELMRGGVTQTQAQDLFGQAATDLPVLNILARRHADVDDDFDLNEFTQAAVFDDPVQRRRMRRLVAQERATFSGSGFGQDRSGAVAGLNLP
jgi:hypothetical protein